MIFGEYMKHMLLFFIFLVHSQLIVATGEKVPFALLRRLMPDKPIILEAGAQWGEDTAWMSEFWPKVTIHAFEPNPPSYKKLLATSKKYNNIFTYQLALSHTSGQFPFYVDGHSGGASSLLRPTERVNRDYFHADLEHPIIVNVVTLDEWAKEHKVDHIDFMWLDLEGNELNMLKGATEMLKTVQIIYTEVNLQIFWEGCVRYAQLARWLEEQGFEKVWEDIVPTWHGNVLFVRK